jgi:hypothetical protein
MLPTETVLASKKADELFKQTLTELKSATGRGLIETGLVVSLTQPAFVVIERVTLKLVPDKYV